LFLLSLVYMHEHSQFGTDIVELSRNIESTDNVIEEGMKLTCNRDL